MVGFKCLDACNQRQKTINNSGNNIMYAVDDWIYIPERICN